MNTHTSTRIDLRDITPRERHALVFSSFERLPAGEGLELVNDHDPAPLRQQFEDRLPGGYGWTSLQAGPAQWRVLVTKTAKTPALAVPVAAGSCCSGGACCA